MNFVNRIKSFLGLSTENDPNQLSINRPTSQDSTREDAVIIPRDRNNYNEYVPDHYDRFGFNMFSNPLEMHRYFEHQMNEIMKNFGMFGNHDFLFGGHGEPFFGGNGEPFFDDNTFGNDFPHFPAIEDSPTLEQPQKSLREQYLKPGFEQPKINEKHKSDKDLDGQLHMGDLDSVFKGSPVPAQPKVRTFVYGQSVSTQTVRRPDGTIETHRTVRDQQGNEETTVTRRQGDKEYSITTRKDKNGQQEVVENLINMDENDKDAFLKDSSVHTITPQKPPSWFPFDRFFKN